MSAIFKRFQAARRAADKKLTLLPNVVGSCLGVKRKKGASTGEPCFTVLVSRKVPEERLEPSAQIPFKVRRFGLTLPTDVVRIGTIRREGGFGIDDHVQQGTVGAFARRGGKYYALTCAHCIGGVDRNPATPSPIRIDFPMPRTDILDLGNSCDGKDELGTGHLPEFGEFDAGLVEIFSDIVLEYVRTRSVLNSYRPDASDTLKDIQDALRSTPVEAWGAKTADIVRAQVTGALVTHTFGDYDLMISDPTERGISQRGDSGMMWLGPSGEAVGLHMAGDGGGVDGMSINAFASFAYRSIDRFGIELLRA